MRILVIGKNGQLGRSIYEIVNKTNDDVQPPNEFIFVGRKELDLSSNTSIINYFNDHNKFDIIINCAAFTAVDLAEQEQGIANQINNLAVKQLAQIANEQKMKLVHISTDYVFDGMGRKPYKETDKTNPINVYGKTKLAGEQALHEIMPTDAMIIRTSWVFSEFGNNFLKTILKLGKERKELNVVNDQIGSPTYATDLASLILEIIKDKDYLNKKQYTEIYNYSNKGKLSWYDFTREILKIAKVDCKVNPITTHQYQTLAQRPKNTVMSKDKIIEEFEVEILDWKESLQVCIKNIENKK